MNRIFHTILLAALLLCPLRLRAEGWEDTIPAPRIRNTTVREWRNDYREQRHIRRLACTVTTISIVGLAASVIIVAVMAHQAAE